MKIRQSAKGPELRGRRAKKTRETNMILELIPRDGWVFSKEIGDKLGMTPAKVGIIITHRLASSLVERKQIVEETTGKKRQAYRRIDVSVRDDRKMTGLDKQLLREKCGHNYAPGHN